MTPECAHATCESVAAWYVEFVMGDARTYCESHLNDLRELDESTLLDGAEVTEIDG